MKQIQNIKQSDGRHRFVVSYAILSGVPLPTEDDLHSFGRTVTTTDQGRKSEETNEQEVKLCCDT